MPRSASSRRSRPRRSPWRRWVLKSILFLLVLGLTGAMGSALWAFTILPRELPSVKALEEFTPIQGARLYSDEDEPLTEIQEERRIFVPLAQIPKHLQQAILAVEDHRFYSHFGLNVGRIVKALWANLREGRAAEGASTITQQLTRVLFLTPDKSLSRKIQEAILAIQLERKYSKDRILELYLNHIYLGHGGFGVEVASRTYFGKPVSEVTLNEAALLAALPRSPGKYSPFERPEAAKRRRAYVLDRMVKLGYITEAQAASARIASLGVVPPEKRKGVAQYFVEYVHQLLEAKYGPEMVYKGGLQVYTTLNPSMQVAAERALRDGLLELSTRTAAKPPAGKERKTPPPPKPPLLHPEGALITLDPQTGYVKAMVGGFDFSRSEFNRAVNAKRQPGSAFKPFVYIAGLEAGLSPATLMEDTPVSYPGKNGEEWKPENYTKSYLGMVTLQRALEESINVPTVRLLEKVGIDKVVEVSRRMGITSPLPLDLTLALGSADVTLLEITSAFGVLANGGKRMEPLAIRYITDANGKLLEENIPQEREALRPEIAYVATQMLRGAVERGTGIRAKALGRPIAAKTGTTNDFSNAWFLGFTPKLVTGVWVGYDKPRSLGESETGSRVAVPIWVSYMGRVLAGHPAEDFPVPDRVVTLAMDLNTGCRAAIPTATTVNSAFILGTEPQLCPGQTHADLRDTWAPPSPAHIQSRSNQLGSPSHVSLHSGSWR